MSTNGHPVGDMHQRHMAVEGQWLHPVTSIVSDAGAKERNTSSTLLFYLLVLWALERGSWQCRTLQDVMLYYFSVSFEWFI